MYSLDPNTTHISPVLRIWLENWTFRNQTANYKLFLIQKVCYSDAQSFGTRHLNGGPVFKWGSEYQSVNQMGIWILNYLSTEHLNRANHLTIEQIPMVWIPTLFAIQIPTVFRSFLNSGDQYLDPYLKTQIIYRHTANNNLWWAEFRCK